MVPGCLRVSTDHMSKTGRRNEGTTRRKGRQDERDDGMTGRVNL